MCPVFSEDIWRYSKNAGAATSTGHVFVYWTTSNATLTSVNGTGWHVFLGKVHVWHPREEGALTGDHQSDWIATKITKKAEGFQFSKSSSPFPKAPFWGEGYLLVSYGFQEGGCVHADFCDECVVASDFLSIKPLRILRFTSHQPCLPANPYPCRSF